MSKKIEIIDGFNTIYIKSGKHAVVCVADKDRKCSPNCAACSQRGQNYYCQKNGTDKEFQIGYIISA